MAGTSPSPVTFGVELEFAIKKDKDGRETYESLFRDLGHGLAPDVDLPIAGYCRCCLRDELCAGCASVDKEFQRVGEMMTIYKPLSPNDSHVSVTIPTYRYLYIDNEMCYESYDEEFGMEVTTPILDSTELDNNFPKLTQVVKALNSLNFEISINNRCGLHVHVGMKNNLTLLKAQRGLTLIALLETPLLFSMQPVERRILPGMLTGPSSPVTLHSVIAGDLTRFEPRWGVMSRNKAVTGPLVDSAIPPEARIGNPLWEVRGHHPVTLQPARETKIQKFLNGVWTAATLRRLGQALLDEDGTKLGVFIVTRRDPTTRMLEGAHSTFEFCYSHMTFDIEYIRIWVSIVTRIVELAELDAENFAEKTAEILGALRDWDEAEPDKSFSALLTVLGFGEQLEQWMKVIIKHHTGEH